MSEKFCEKQQIAKPYGVSTGFKLTIAAAVTIVLLLIVGSSFLTDKVGQILAGVLTTIITTLVSIYATYHSSSISSAKSAKDELTRYGLLAWRNLDSLQLKVNQELDQNTTGNQQILRGWLLDIDQAKWAWQDILREVFDLQERLQVETNELAREYKDKIGAARPADRVKLEAEKQAHFARLSTSSPLPLKIPAEVTCPNCSNPVAILIGQNTGDTSTLRCPTCRRMFHAHRAADGSLFTRKQGGAEPKSSSEETEAKHRLRELEAVRDVFAAASEEVLVGGWDEFFPKLTEHLRTAELGPDDARIIQKWLFQLKAFRLLGPGQGIGIPVNSSEFIDYVEERYLEEAIKRGSELTAEQLCVELYDTDTERLSMLRALVNRRKGDGSGNLPEK